MVSTAHLVLIATALAQTPSAPQVQAGQVSGVPQNVLDYGKEFAAIQVANYRIPSVSHADAVEQVRDGLNLYVQQAPIQNLISQAFEYYTKNADAFNNLKWTPPSADFNLKAVQSFVDANFALASDSNFAPLEEYVSSHISNFDLGAAMADLQNLVELDPVQARSAVGKVQQKIASNQYNQRAYSSAIEAAKEFGQKYGVDTEKLHANFVKLVNALI